MRTAWYRRGGVLGASLTKWRWGSPRVSHLQRSNNLMRDVSVAVTGQRYGARAARQAGTNLFLCEFEFGSGASALAWQASLSRGGGHFITTPV